MFSELLERAYRRQSWHGTNLRGSIRGLTLSEITRRPKPGRHNIWELVVHCAYWKYVVRRRLTGEKRGSFPLDGSNFFSRPSRPRKDDERHWKSDVALLDAMHEQLLGTVKTLKRPSKKAAWMIQGVAAHDLYHAGQIQLIKKL